MDLKLVSQLNPNIGIDVFDLETMSLRISGKFYFWNAFYEILTMEPHSFFKYYEPSF